MRLIEPPPSPHRCDLPSVRGGYGSTGARDGTIAVCDKCNAAWFSGPCFQDYGPTTHWRRVRWFHWRLLRRVALTEPVDPYRKDV